MAQVRGQTYADYAWPPAAGRAVPTQRPDAVAGAGAGLALFLALPLARKGGCGRQPARRQLLRGVPAQPDGGLFAPVFGFALLALGIGVRASGACAGHRRAPAGGPAAAEALHDALRLRYLDGGHGEGCNNADDAFTLRAGASTTPPSTASCCASPPPAWPRCTTTARLVGALRLTSLPKLLGTVGGISLLGRHCRAVAG
jgi:citrate/tricarballylate utilization protein